LPAPCAPIPPGRRTCCGRRFAARQLERLKFKRQVPLGGYIVDFVCFEAKLIVEVEAASIPSRNRIGNGMAISKARVSER
jgi:hypothetical protein